MSIERIAHRIATSRLVHSGHSIRGKREESQGRRLQNKIDFARINQPAMLSSVYDAWVG